MWTRTAALSRSGGEDTHAVKVLPTPSSNTLLAHKEACTKNPLVLIVGEDGARPAPSEDFLEASRPAFRQAARDSEAAEETAAGAGGPEGGGRGGAGRSERRRPAEVGAPATRAFFLRPGRGDVAAAPPPGSRASLGRAYGAQHQRDSRDPPGAPRWPWAHPRTPRARARARHVCGVAAARSR